MHCTADYIVTIDSDCVFLVPVTPRMLFTSYETQDRRVILLSHKDWQWDLWVDATNTFYDGRLSGGPKSPSGWYQENHMVAQPVTFRRDTFVRWRKFITERNGKCFAQQLVDAHRLVPPPGAWPTGFCWMCILGTWITQEPSEAKLYDFARYSDKQSKGRNP